MMGIQNKASICCSPLFPCCWDTKYGSHILYPLEDQRGDTECSGDTKYDITLLLSIHSKYYCLGIVFTHGVQLLFPQVTLSDD